VFFFDYWSKKQLTAAKSFFQLLIQKMLSDHQAFSFTTNPKNARWPPCAFLDFVSKKHLVATKRFLEFPLFGDHENIMQATCIFYDSHYSLILKTPGGCTLLRYFLQLVIKKCLIVTKHFMRIPWNGNLENT
jgi:hypothetical protein